MISRGYLLRDLWFSWRWLRSIQSSGMCHRVVWYVNRSSRLMSVNVYQTKRHLNHANKTIKHFALKFFNVYNRTFRGSLATQANFHYYHAPSSTASVHKNSKQSSDSSYSCTTMTHEIHSSAHNLAEWYNKKSVWAASETFNFKKADNTLIIIQFSM